MVPPDHLPLPDAHALLAIVVVRQPDGLTHFVLAWRRHRPLAQVMDPAVGRRWISWRGFLQDVYLHEQAVPASAWCAWAATDDFRGPLRRRLRDLGLGRAAAALFAAADAAPDWTTPARLDAATRMVASLVRAGGQRRGREARGVLRSLLERNAAQGPGSPPIIPAAYWSVRPGRRDPDGAEPLLLRGAVLVRVLGRKPADEDKDKDEDDTEGPARLSPELAAALGAPPTRVGRALRARLRGDGPVGWALLALFLGLAAGRVPLEALLLRVVADLGRFLGPYAPKLAAVAALGVFLLLGLLLEWRVAASLRRLGRRLEVGLRVAFLDKLPRLHDRYLQSRPISDMAERSHALAQVRDLPYLVAEALRTGLTLFATAAAVAWVAPECARPALLSAALALAVPLLGYPLERGLDLRVQTHVGALSRHYLDALLGLTAVRAHGAERSLRREHEGLVVEWAHASRRLLVARVSLDAIVAVAGTACAVWIVFRYTGRMERAGGVLLLTFWALSLPLLGEALALRIGQYPTQRNLVLRLLEPLGAPEEPDAAAGSPSADTTGAGPAASLAFEGVTVTAAGQTILDAIDLRIEPGSHLAIVGVSGAGKSSLLGLLLGWHRPARGRVLVDGAALDPAGLDRLRHETAWVDPAVRLWNRSLLANLRYGAEGRDVGPLAEALDAADLHDVLGRLPDGLQTALGEGGGLLSGGEGQRVRLGRALHRGAARLVLLDEPFRGLDRPRRQRLLKRARLFWRGATLLCVTHDIAETRDFPRVLVIGEGTVREDGPPEALAADPGSRYRALLDAEQAVRDGLWGGAQWRRYRLEEGRLVGGSGSVEVNGRAPVADDGKAPFLSGAPRP